MMEKNILLPLLKKKCDIFACYKDYEALVETQYSTKVKHLQSDQGEAYMSEEFDQHLKLKPLKLTLLLSVVQSSSL